MSNKKRRVIYRPPNTDIDMFNDKLDNVLDTINNEGNICCIMGGYNINTLDF